MTVSTSKILDDSTELSQSELKALGPRPMRAEALKTLFEMTKDKANLLDVDEPLL